MKSILAALQIFLLTLAAQGQGNDPGSPVSGKITYAEKVKIDIRIEGDAAHLAAMLPKERKTEKILSFTPEISLFEEGNSIDEDMNMEEGGAMRIKMIGSAGNKIFADFKTGSIIEQRDFLNRIFLVEKKLPENSWKVTGNQKIIQGFTCLEATRTDTAGIKTVVWFTPSIATKGGPAGFCNLPGMVLEVDVNNGSTTFVATSIEEIPIKDLKLERPKEGKKVTEEEFQELVAEKMKEMGMEQGGETGSGARMHIIIKQ
jgi:GLPGLI family protein